MKQESTLAFCVRRLAAMMVTSAALSVAACDSPTGPRPEVNPAAALLQARASATMKRVAGVAGSRPEQLRNLSPEQVKQRISSAIERLSAMQTHDRLALLASRSYAGFDAEMTAVREYTGEHYGAVMKKAHRDRAAALQLLAANDPALEGTFDCGLGIAGVGIADCEGDGEEWDGGEWYDGPWYLVSDDSPYCLKEVAAYTGAYLLTVATLRAYTARPSRETLNAVLFATAGWFYAADVLSGCINRELAN